MRSFIILLFITWLFPVGIWAQFKPNNPEEPSAEPPYANFSSEVYKLGVKFDNIQGMLPGMNGILAMARQARKRIRSMCISRLEIIW